MPAHAHPLLFLGASIIQQWTTTGRPVWDRHFAPLGALNLGMAGETSGQLWWRLQNNFLRGLAPRVVVLQVGANDVTLTAQQVAQTLGDITGLLRGQLPHATLLLHGIFPTGPRDGTLRLKNTATNGQIQALSDGQRVQVLDCGALFVDGNGDIPAALMPDGLHLALEAYELWAGVLVPRVTQALAGSAPK
jgi:lysophospholipase L1-like esterase